VQIYNKKNNTWIKNKILNLNEKLHSYNPIILLYQTFSRAIKYKDICKKESINISISHWDSLNLSNILSKILFWNKSSIYIFLHNSLSFYKNKWSFIYKYLFDFLYPKADKIITISEEMALELKSKWYKNIHTLFNPVDLENIEKEKKESLWNYEKVFNSKKKTFITIWRLDKVKNIEFSIKAFDIFNKENPNFQFIIIWDWKEKNSIEKTINKTNNKNIILLWKQNNVYKFLNRSDYFIFSSLNEWFWRVLIEALASWIPILTHDFKYGAKEIIRNNNDFTECKKLELHKNWILVPYLNEYIYIKWMELISKNKFNKTKIYNSIQKYDIKNLNEKWKIILNNK
jgi:glycosyltransferase involved in cell wall biosynthesis